MSGTAENPYRFRRIIIAAQAARELGLRPLGYLALYRFGLRTGHYRRSTSPRLAERLSAAVQQPEYASLWDTPSVADLDALMDENGRAQLLAEAERIVSGGVKLFGALDVPLRLVSSAPLVSWTAYEGGVLAAPGRPEEDIKFVWEPARFGWAFTLGRAYLLTGDERYPRAFWERFEEFSDGNPPYLGPHWASAQEVGLRLIAFSFALQLFQPSPESRPERVLRLLRSVAVHAGRIPPTLPYALAQNNNHLLSEAAALVTAGRLLPNHPQADGWRRTGWRLFNRGLLAQIDTQGAYGQHSANYQRLMLQLGLWMQQLSNRATGRMEPEAVERLAAATRWLLALLDPVSGRVPNLGPNDGAYIFPLSACPFDDYRPVLQAAARAFLGQRPLQMGPWDEMSLWFCGSRVPRLTSSASVGRLSSTPHVLRSPDGNSWAYLRAARFTGRPGHADQLHLDLWWRGLNVAQDAGTYLYNAPPPWDNALTHAQVHNTVRVDGRDQMTRAGRFLYVDRAQAEIENQDRAEDGRTQMLAARHTGYCSRGVWHSRVVKCHAEDRWEIVDQIYPVKPSASEQIFTASLHWLIPDWAWEIQADTETWDIHLNLETPLGPMRLHFDPNPDDNRPISRQLQIVRAGKLVYGSGDVSPIWGWFSHTYGVKIPALSVRYAITGSEMVRFRSCFSFPVS